MSWSSKVTNTSNASNASIKSKIKNNVCQVDRPDTRSVVTPDEVFDNKYIYSVIVLEEKMRKYLEFTGNDSQLLSNLRVKDLMNVAKEYSSKYNKLEKDYNNKIEYIYEKAGYTMQNVEIDVDNLDENSD